MSTHNTIIKVGFIGLGRMGTGMAETLRVPMPLASLLHDRLLTLIARGGEGLDWSALGQLAATDAGLGELSS